MKKSTKAALLSGLIFPGVGQLYLKKYLSALVLLGAACFMIYFIFVNALEQATQIVERIQNGEAAADLTSITGMVSAQSASEEGLLNMAPTAFLFIWVLGIVHAYSLGRRQDKLENI